MKKREFNKAISRIIVAGRPNVVYIHRMGRELRLKVVNFIIRHRGPVLVDLIPKGVPYAQYASLGYLYVTKGHETKLTFLHTAENRIQ